MTIVVHFSSMPRCSVSPREGLKGKSGPLHLIRLTGLACVSQKTRKLYGPEKPFVKLRPAYSVKLVFLYVVKGIKVKITAKFRDTGLLRRYEENNVTRKVSGLSRNGPLARFPRSHLTSKSFVKTLMCSYERAG